MTLEAAPDQTETVTGGEVKQPAKPLSRWMRIVCGVLPLPVFWFAIKWVIEAYQERTANISQKITPTEYSISIPSAGHFILTLGLSLLLILLGLNLLATAFNKRLVIFQALLFMFLPITFVLGFITTAIQEDTMLPNRTTGTEWLAKTYKINNIDLPYNQTSKFYAVSDTGTKYQFQYTETPNGYTIKRINAN